MNVPDELVLVEDFVLAIGCPNQDYPEIIQTTVKVDLTEFGLTPTELEKVKKIVRKLNFELSDAFSQVCEAASVITEIQQKSSTMIPQGQETYKACSSFISDSMCG